MREKTFKRFVSLIEAVKDRCDQLEEEFSLALDAFERDDFEKCNRIFDLIKEKYKTLSTN